MNIGKAIYGILSGTTAVTDIVGTKIFPEIAEQETAVPFVVYQVQSVQPEDTHDGPSKLDEVRVEVFCYDDAYNGAADLASAVRGALDRVRGTYNGVNVESVQFNDVDFEIEYDPRRYSQVLTFTFRIKRDDIEIALGTPITGAQLGDLSDVNVTGATDNQILSYDAASDTWVPADDAGGAEVLNDLTDVDASQPADNQMLAYQQGEWTTIYQDEIVLPIASVTGLQAELNTIPDGLDDLDDVKIIGAPAEGEALVYQSGFWSRGTAGASTLGDLDDVNTTGAGVGSTIVYNGSTWEISGSELPSDDIYYHNRYLTEAGTLRSGATETVELYYTAQADGDGYAESASSDTATAGFDIRRKLYYSEAAQADCDSGTWVQFADIADDTTFASAKATLLAYLKERTGGTVPISLKMTWEEVAEAPAFTGLLNETYGSGAAAAYSVRRLNGNYTGAAIQVERSSDNTAQDIGFDVDGNLDESALTTFCTGTVCKVRTWYDQSVTGGTGSGNDAVQTVHANQPTIYTGGAIVKDNGRVAVEFDGSTNVLTNTALQNSFEGAAQAFTMLHVAQTDNTSNFQYSFSLLDGANTTLAQNDQIGILAANDNKSGAFIRDYSTSTTSLPKSSAVVGTSQHLNTAVNTGSTLSVYASGTAGDSVSVNYPALAFDYASVGGRYGGSTPSSDTLWNGKIQEILAYASDKSTDRTSIESNIGDYFTQNTPLLDTYTGAAAAYSLRKLRTAYTGAAIEVYNGTSYQDIGFNVFGELDTVSLAAFCGGNNGFVSKWYDQSGNANDATQTTTASQPKIYDSVTGVVTENGKPAVEFDGSDICDLSNFITPSTVSNYSVAGVARPDSNESTIFILSDGTENMQWHYGRTAGELSVGTYDGVTVNYASGSVTIFNQFLGFSTHDFDIPQSTLFIDGNSTSGTADGRGDFNSRIGGGPGGRNWFGAMQEIILWPSDQSSNRANIEDNINTFYSIY